MSIKSAVIAALQASIVLIILTIPFWIIAIGLWTGGIELALCPI